MSTVIPSLSERLADSIADQIRDDGLHPGQALSSSRELAQRFNVTVPTVREALRRLEAVDVVQLRHGSGTYVGAGAGRRLLANPHAGGVDVDAVLELVEARATIEPTIARLAADRRTPEQLAALEQATANALVPQRGDERPVLHFHVALAAASGNALLRETVDALLSLRSPEQVEIRRCYNDRERDHAEHVEILGAVRDRDPAAAADLTRTHLESIRTAVAGSVR